MIDETDADESCHFYSSWAVITCIHTHILYDLIVILCPFGSFSIIIGRGQVKSFRIITYLREAKNQESKLHVFVAVVLKTPIVMSLAHRLNEFGLCGVSISMILY